MGVIPPMNCSLGKCPYGREGNRNPLCPFPYCMEKIKREKGYLYFFGKDGYIWAAPMKHNKIGMKKRVGTERMEKCKYFVNRGV